MRNPPPLRPTDQPPRRIRTNPIQPSIQWCHFEPLLVSREEVSVPICATGGRARIVSERRIIGGVGGVVVESGSSSVSYRHPVCATRGRRAVANIVSTSRFEAITV